MIDIVYGGAWGDEGKGKVVSSLPNYDLYCRYNGGPNAGHTIYVKGEKYAVHQLPSGAVFNKPCYIGPGCVVHIKKLFEEANEIGFDLKNLTIHPNTAIITDEHIKEDVNNQFKTQGSTGSGIAPAYAAKHARTARTFIDYVNDPTYWFLSKIDCNYTDIATHAIEHEILVEAAQGVNLDINHGNYPFVTSSSCLPTAAASALGFPFQLVANVICVIKAYDTRSGKDTRFYPYYPYTEELAKYLSDNESIFKDIAKLGNEKGVTTGRDRQISYLNLDVLCENLKMSLPNSIVINKLDILDELNVYKLYSSGHLWTFETREVFMAAVQDAINDTYYLLGVHDPTIIWSSTPHPDVNIQKALDD